MLPPLVPVRPPGGVGPCALGLISHPTAPLYGFVSDAEAWQAVTLRQLGFNDITVLRDHEATRNAILGALTAPGDDEPRRGCGGVQFAGHGTPRW